MHFTSYGKGRFQVAQTDEASPSGSVKRKQILIVCNAAPMNVYYELRQMFYNFSDYLRAKEKLPINLHVIAPKFQVSLPELAKSIEHYIDDKDIEGVVFANDLLTQFLAGDTAYQHLNYIIPPDSAKNRALKLPTNPYENIPVVYTVPSHHWLRTGGDVKSEGAGVNLLGYVLHAIKFLALGYTEVDISYLHDTKRYPVKPTVIRTIEAFDQLIKKLKRAKYVAIDSEGRNLNRVRNTVFTLQFCIAPDAQQGQNLFVLPIEHAETPWSGKELQYIKKRLRSWLTTANRNKYHIYHNAKFDLIQWINQFDVQWFATPTYDTIAGAFSLDENTKFLKSLGIKGYSLDMLEMRAGFTRPSELVISKEDRGNMAQFSLEDIAKYGAYDVLTVYHLCLQQIKAAKKRNYQGWARFVTQQIGAMIVVFSFMEARGVLVDRAYLEQLASPVGPLADRIKKVIDDLYATKEVQRANKILLKQRSNVVQGGGLFSDKKDPFIFSINNAESLQVLFFNVLGLDPLRERKHGGGSIDKKFQKKYKDTVKHVKLYSMYNALLKLKSAFADSILKTLTASEDALADGRIRNMYWFITVLTGRSSATDPNMQQIPAKGDDAKMIKLQFIATLNKGKIFIKPDFSAHEIRVTGIVSGDKTIKKTFAIANEAIRNLRIAGDNYIEEARLEYKKNGDIHILNVRFFYDGKEVDAEHPLRQDVKITVFQTIYGAQAPSLGKQINKSTEEAQALMDKLFAAWPQAKAYMDDVQKIGSKNLRVFSPIQRPRHLWAYLHPDKFVHFAMNRRGPNSVVQGLASDIGYAASYCIQREIYHTFILPKLKFDGQLLIMVHDSMTNEVSLRFAPVMMYLLEHGMTTLVQRRMEEVFKFKIDIPFGFDMKMGLSEGNLMTWSEMRVSAAEKNFREMAKAGTSAHREQLSDALFNLERIWSVRRRELENDPYEMRLEGRTDWYRDKIRGMV